MKLYTDLTDDTDKNRSFDGYSVKIREISAIRVPT